MKPFPTETAVNFASFAWVRLLRGSDQKVNSGVSHTGKADFYILKVMYEMLFLKIYWLKHQERLHWRKYNSIFKFYYYTYKNTSKLTC